MEVNDSVLTMPVNKINIKIDNYMYNSATAPDLTVNQLKKYAVKYMAKI